MPLEPPCNIQPLLVVRLGLVQGVGVLCKDPSPCLRRILPRPQGPHILLRIYQRHPANHMQKESRAQNNPASSTFFQAAAAVHWSQSSINNQTLSVQPEALVSRHSVARLQNGNDEIITIIINNNYTLSSHMRLGAVQQIGCSKMGMLLQKGAPLIGCITQCPT